MPDTDETKVRAPRAGRPRRFEADDASHPARCRPRGHGAQRLHGRGRGGHPATGRPVDPFLLPALRIEGPAPLPRCTAARPRRSRTRLCAKVGAAANARAALDAWIDEIVSLRHHRTKAVRLAVLGSPGAMKAEGYAEETRRCRGLLMTPLATLLVEGHADGSFPLADPAADAPLIQSAVWAAAGLTPTGTTPSSKGEAVRQVRSFCERALGAAPGAQAVLRAAPRSGRQAPSCSVGTRAWARLLRPGRRRRSRARRRCDTVSPTAARA